MYDLEFFPFDKGRQNTEIPLLAAGIMFHGPDGIHLEEKKI